MLGKETDNAGEEKRRAAIVRVIMRKLLNGLKRVHSLGLVHRDVRQPLSPLLKPIHPKHGPHSNSIFPMLYSNEAKSL